jgi:glutamate-1-semialdehyde 2,1-aminomutase
MARFARSGGEANAIAVRIARAASGKDKIAICGYHGWHDWYLAANLGDERNLAGHLLPGLEPKGVPKTLQGSVLPFKYNDFGELRSLAEEHAIGVIMMEVSRNFGPRDDFCKRCASWLRGGASFSFSTNARPDSGRRSVVCTSCMASSRI